MAIIDTLSTISPSGAINMYEEINFKLPIYC